jgi:hypothetical protein
VVSVPWLAETCIPLNALLKQLHTSLSRGTLVVLLDACRLRSPGKRLKDTAVVKEPDVLRCVLAHMGGRI